MRINPKTFATKALAMDAAMPDELVQLEEQITAAKRARDKWLKERPAVARRLAHLRDTAPLARSNAPFSIFADASREPR
jgi:hypothetical protein